MADINLHFTGDFHAISSAHALLSAMLDNHLQQGNPLGIDTRRITWPRTIDMNDRALRHAVIGLGGAGERRRPRGALGHHSGERGHGDRRARDEPRGSRAPARPDHRRRRRRARRSRRCARATSRRRARWRCCCRDAHLPESRPDARGRSRDRARRPVRQHRARLQQHPRDARRRSRSATSSSPRPGFGSDLGAEKFFDIKCRVGGLEPGGGGARRDRALAQDAGGRRQARARHRRSARRSSAGCRISSTTSGASASSACRSSSRSTGSSPTPRPS